METIFPSLWVPVAVALFSILRIENQRWALALGQNWNRGVATHIDSIGPITANFARVFALAFVASYGFEFGWLAAFGLLAIVLIAPLVHAVFATKDNWFNWILSTILLWPVMAILAFSTNWFGLLTH